MSIGAALALAVLLVSAIQRLRSSGLRPLERGVIGTSICFAFASLIALALSACGLLGAGNFAVSCLAMAALLRFGPRPAGLEERAPTRLDNHGLLASTAIALLVLLGLGLRGQPMDNPLGGRDAGSYTLRTQQTLRSGNLEFVDEGLLEAEARYNNFPSAGLEDLLGAFPIEREGVRVDRYEAPYRPGFYLADRETGRVQAQFFHLYPSSLAIGGFLFGPEALHRSSLFIAALFLLTWTCIILRVLANANACFVALGLLVLCPLAIWTDRQTLSETSYGLWLALAFLSSIHKSEESGGEPDKLHFGYLAALFLGCATLTRGDAWVWAPFVLAALWCRSYKSTPWAARIFAAIFAAGIVFHSYFAFAYLHDELLRRWPGGEPPTPNELSLLALSGFVGWLAIDLLLASRPRPAPESEAWRSHAKLQGQAVAGGLLALAIGYLLTNEPGQSPYSRLDPLVPSLGWPWLALALAGLLALARQQGATLAR